jgi:hypothetical protein
MKVEDAEMEVSTARSEVRLAEIQGHGLKKAMDKLELAEVSLRTARFLRDLDSSNNNLRDFAAR